MRIYIRCGSDREVHGAITDLSRIVVVKLTGIDDNALPIVVKTAVHEGDNVRAMLTSFVCAVPHLLSVEGISFAFPSDGGTVSRPQEPVMIECGKALGRGLHGKVFTVVGEGSSFIKHFHDASECTREATILQTLKSHNIPFVPTLSKVSVDGQSFLACPIGRSSYHWQGRVLVWKMGRLLIDSLERLHTDGGLCHRDIRPSNIVVGAHDLPLLIDWASATTCGTPTQYVGTIHYAANEVLTQLENLELPTPSPSHDLESLVYSIYDLSREGTNRPAALSLNEESFNSERAQRGIKKQLT
jgi:hypothetical protein